MSWQVSIWKNGAVDEKKRISSTAQLMEFIERRAAGFDVTEILIERIPNGVFGEFTPAAGGRDG